MKANHPSPHMLLGDVVRFGNGKSIKPGGEGCYPVYGSNGIIGGSPEFKHENGLIIGRVGAYCGAVSYCPGRFWASDNTLVVYPASPDFDTQFLFYLLTDAKLSKYAGGAAQPLVTQTVLKQVEVRVPPLSVQRRIASILSAYEELIENSQRRIRLLEDMARALYREWFVHFRFPRDPSEVLAKEGSDPLVALAKEDGHESVPRLPSALGDIPQGWEVKKLGEIAVNFDRLRKPISKMQRAEMQGEYPYYGAAKVFDYVNDFIFDGEYLLMAEDGSVITTERAPVLQLVNEKFWPNNHTHVLRGKPPYSTHFLYLGLADVDIPPYITGAAQPKITQENMNRIPFFCGPESLHIEFNRLVAPMISQSQLLQRQIQNLRRTRDLLLPRLLSGQVALEEAAN